MLSAMGGTDDAAQLVERDEHLARFATAAAGALDGEGSLIVIEGPPGIGKTGLLDACRAHAVAAGLTVLDARSRELERDFTLGVVRQLFERILHEADDAARSRLLAGPAAHGFATILADGPAADRHHTPGDSDFAAMHSLYWLAANLAAEGPLMLAVDDAHWADAASLRFLTYLVNRLAGLPVVIVCATRPRAGGTAAAALDELASAATSVLTLGVLSPDGTASVVRRRAGAVSPAFGAACHESSGGNPFLLHELLSALVADGVVGDDAGAERVRRLGPQSVSRAVFLRMARLPPGAADVARAVAILGDHVELRDAAALAGISRDDAHELSDALSAAGVLAAELPLRFIHPVILEAVSADLGAGQRTAMHLRAATLLHERGAGADQIAAHLSAVGPVGDAWVVDVLRRAAAAATDRGAPEVARRHLERALHEDQGPAVRAALLAELGEAEWMAADDPAAVIAHMREAAQLTDDPAVRVQATITMARAIFTTGDAIGASRALLEALESDAVLGPEGTVRLEAEYGSVGLLNFDLMPESRTRMLALRDQIGDESGEPLLLANFAVLAWMEASAEKTARVARAALDEGRLLEEVGSDTIAFLQACWVLLGADRLDEARRAIGAGLAQARERGTFFGFAACCVLAAMNAYRAGDLRESEAHSRAGLEVGESPLFLRPAALAYLALALIERGELEEAEQALVDGLVGEWLPPLAQMNIGFYARGLLRVAQGRDEEAVADLLEFGRREAYTGVANGSVDFRVPAARALLRLGRVDEAQALLDEQERVARRWGTPASLGCALAGQAAAVAAQGDGDGITLLEEASALLEAAPCRLQHARVALELGMAQRRAGQRGAAQVTLTRCVELARSCGATVLAQRAFEELEVSGARPRRLQFSGADSLTASERRVALMAADGQSNAQIAQELFVTAKTVENHLGRVYVKLGINSRKLLAESLRGQAEGSSLMPA